MTEATTHSYQDQHPARSGWAAGISIFAGAMMVTLGLFQFFEGLTAVLKDDVYVTTRDYVFQFDITTWGWIHLVIGVVAVLVGGCILAGQAWAFITGIIIAGLSALTNFMFIPWYPLWAIVVIAFDLAVIWALCVRLGDET
jgi:hypothetical protein